MAECRAVRDKSLCLISRLLRTSEDGHEQQVGAVRQKAPKLGKGVGKEGWFWLSTSSRQAARQQEHGSKKEDEVAKAQKEIQVLKNETSSLNDEIKKYKEIQDKLRKELLDLKGSQMPPLKKKPKIK
ncbi:hypothetical protein HPP92_006264 [Vanilla planifolia]|uniref:Uncharacterized protein n=1 Tax=Vanilla planifolia TaxID=51239 RepID=A0A835RVI6_VANPL|nr:hypothetical protein HPP92_006264 [Vanilla planifolia]